MKTIPLSEPMGGDSSCCIHSELCEAIVKSIDNEHIKFRCPLVVEVDDDVEYPGVRHESCFEVNDDAKR